MNGRKYTKKGLLTRILMLIVWIGVLVFIADGLGYFPVMVEMIGYGLTEALLWLLLIIPAVCYSIYLIKYYEQETSHKNKKNRKKFPN